MSCYLNFVKFKCIDLLCEADLTLVEAPAEQTCTSILISRGPKNALVFAFAPLQTAQSVRLLRTRIASDENTSKHVFKSAPNEAVFGTQMEVKTRLRYAPGERTLRPRLMRTKARESMRVFEYVGLGFTA
eukprot:4550927-Pleurochrysis_carterae.AAC.1